MKRYVSALAVALCLVSFSKAQAASSSMQHELLINGNYGSSFNAIIGNNGGGTQFGADVGYLYSIHEMFQVGAELGLGWADGPGELINLKAVAAVNFAMNQGSFHSVFIQGQAGWNQIHKSARQFVWAGDLGIRYKIFENVTWRPTLGVTDQGGGIYFRANLLAMSLVF